MSKSKTSDDESDFPYITVTNLGQWDMYLRNYLKGKNNSDTVLDLPKPKVDQARWQRLSDEGVANVRTKQYEEFVKLKKVLWEKQNGIAVSVITRATKKNNTATILLLENQNKSAKELYTLITSRVIIKQFASVKRQNSRNPTHSL